MPVELVDLGRLQRISGTLPQCAAGVGARAACQQGGEGVARIVMGTDGFKRGALRIASRMATGRFARVEGLQPRSWASPRKTVSKAPDEGDALLVG